MPTRGVTSNLLMFWCSLRPCTYNGLMTIQCLVLEWSWMRGKSWLWGCIGLSNRVWCCIGKRVVCWSSLCCERQISDKVFFGGGYQNRICSCCFSQVGHEAMTTKHWSGYDSWGAQIEAPNLHMLSQVLGWSCKGHLSVYHDPWIVEVIPRRSIVW